MNIIIDADELIMLKRALYYAIILEETNLEGNGVTHFGLGGRNNIKEDIKKFKKLKDKLNGK